jgi:UDP-N-acetyl-D-mannosaminuronate dehydrogenase
MFKKIVVIGMGYIGIAVSQKKIQNPNVNIFNP